MTLLAYLYELPTNNSGLDVIASGTIAVIPSFVPLILFFIFSVMFIGGITRQKIRSGTADYSAWAVISSIATLLPALFFSVSEGFIRLEWLVIVVAINILSAIWFFMDRKVTEI